MQKNKSNPARRVWNILRMVLLWTRKGGAYRRRLMMDLRHVPKFLKSTLGHSSRNLALPYGEHELSFDKTPIIHVKMHRPSSMRFKMPNIPCINPEIELEYDYEWNNENDAVSYCNEEVEARRSFLTNGEEDKVECEVIEEGDKEIDHKAEEFIANFYKQIKMQRQISYLEYN